MGRFLPGGGRPRPRKGKIAKIAYRVDRRQDGYDNQQEQDTRGYCKSEWMVLGNEIFAGSMIVSVDRELFASKF